MFGFCFILGKNCRQFFAFHRHTTCGNGRVSSASLVFVAILFLQASSKKFCHADRTFKNDTLNTNTCE